jgi:hypothetical protein
MTMVCVAPPSTAAVGDSESTFDIIHSSLIDQASFDFGTASRN